LARSAAAQAEKHFLGRVISVPGVVSEFNDDNHNLNCQYFDYGHNQCIVTLFLKA
jgi:hypothetical protein